MLVGCLLLFSFNDGELLRAWDEGEVGVGFWRWHSPALEKKSTESKLGASFIEVWKKREIGFLKGPFRTNRISG